MVSILAGITYLNHYEKISTMLMVGIERLVCYTQVIYLDASLVFPCLIMTMSKYVDQSWPKKGMVTGGSDLTKMMPKSCHMVNKSLRRVEEVVEIKG